MDPTVASLRLTGALLRRVLMPCLLFTSSSSFTGLNIKEAPDLEAGGRQPCLFSYVRHDAHSSRLPLPTWCHSLESGEANSLTWKGDWSFTWHTHTKKKKMPCPREIARAYLSHRSGCSSSSPVRCRRYRDHPRWQNLRLLLRKHVGVREGRISFHQKANTFPPNTELTWITAWRRVGGSCRRASLCFARGRLSPLLSVSSGSCRVRGLFPVVIEVDQLALINSVKRVEFLNKTTSFYDYIFTIFFKCWLNYRLFAGQKVFANTEEVLAVLPEAFNEAFL